MCFRVLDKMANKLTRTIILEFTDSDIPDRHLVRFQKVKGVLKLMVSLKSAVMSCENKKNYQNILSKYLSFNYVPNKLVIHYIDKKCTLILAYHAC